MKVVVGPSLLHLSCGGHRVPGRQPWLAWRHRLCSERWDGRGSAVLAVRMARLLTGVGSGALAAPAADGASSNRLFPLNSSVSPATSGSGTCRHGSPVPELVGALVVGIQDWEQSLAG